MCDCFLESSMKLVETLTQSIWPCSAAASDITHNTRKNNPLMSHLIFSKFLMSPDDEKRLLYDVSQLSIISLYPHANNTMI